MTPFIVPQLGPHYRIQWEQEDYKLAQLVDDGVQNAGMAINREYFELEDTVYDGDMDLGRYSERLLGALVREGLVPNQQDDDVEDPSNANKVLTVHPRSKTDLSIFEDRLKAELTHLGLLAKQDIDPACEVTQLLLKSQQELREQIQANATRKRTLLKIAEEHVAYQEYQTLLSDINKSVDNAYVKRFVIIDFNCRRAIRKN